MRKCVSFIQTEAILLNRLKNKVSLGRSECEFLVCSKALYSRRTTCSKTRSNTWNRNPFWAQRVTFKLNPVMKLQGQRVLNFVTFAVFLFFFLRHEKKKEKHTKQNRATAEKQKQKLTVNIKTRLRTHRRRKKKKKPQEKPPASRTSQNK